MRLALAARTLAPLLGLAGVVSCKSSQVDPYPPFDPLDASIYDAAGSPSVDASVADRASSSTLSDGRVVTGGRPIFQWYSRDTWYLDAATKQVAHALTLIRSDGSIVVTGCSGKATPAELASFEAVATDLATLDALKQNTACPAGAAADDVTVTYEVLGSLKHSASCDPQLQKLTAAGSALTQSICSRNADGGTDAGGDAP